MPTAYVTKHCMKQWWILVSPDGTYKDVLLAFAASRPARDREVYLMSTRRSPHRAVYYNQELRLGFLVDVREPDRHVIVTVVSREVGNTLRREHDRTRNGHGKKSQRCKAFRRQLDQKRQERYGDGE